ncbi:hypothetical protein Pan153_22230 [Gimesia panareensis]|uniref:Uncharacterized protein n=1 Tax=Gimesia panareensis TaxID=2527978 RepID=A0A518FMM8_9PLAN|nr:hypothetical protein Pan153_22230 [Gimesia panareensis]
MNPGGWWQLFFNYHEKHENVLSGLLEYVGRFVVRGTEIEYDDCERCSLC